MFNYITEHFVAHWRKFLLPMFALLLATMHFYFATSVQHYADRAVSYSAQSSLTTADLLAYNDQLTGIEFLDTLENLDSVELAYYPMTVWGHVIVDERSTQVALRSVPPAGMQREQFFTGSYPQGDGEIALPHRLATFLEVETGDSLIVTFPSIGDAGVARNVRVSGTYAYSPLGDPFDNSLNAVIGMDLGPFWDSSTGRFPLTQDGVFVVGSPGVSVDELKESLLSIRGTVAETRPERAEKFRQTYVTNVSNLAKPLTGLFILPILGVTIVLLIAGRALVRDRIDDINLLNILGASHRRMFTATFAQFMAISAIIISVGLALGHGLVVIAHQTLMNSPGSRFMPPTMDSSWTTVGWAAILSHVIAAIAATVVSLYTVKIAKSPWRSREFTKATPTAVIAMMAGFVATTIALVLITSVITRQTHNIGDLLVSPSLVPTLAISAIVVVLFLLAHHGAGQLIKRASVALHIPVSLSTQRSQTMNALSANTARVTSWLTVLSCAMLAALASVSAAGSSYFSALARDITPYDISIQAPNSTQYPLTESAVATISNFDEVDRALPVYSESLGIVGSDGTETGRSIFVYSVDPDAAQAYFHQGSNLIDGLSTGKILIPDDVLRFLGLSAGDSITFSGPKSQLATLEIVNTDSPWVMMTDSDLEVLSGIHGPSELWLELDEAHEENSGLSFIDMRENLMNVDLAENYRVSSAITADVIEVITDRAWSVPLVSVLLAIALALSVVGTVRSQSLMSTARIEDARLVRSLGVNYRRALMGSLTLTIAKVGVDAAIGATMGATLYYTAARMDVLGSESTMSRHLPVQALTTIVAAAVVVAVIAVLIQHIAERKSWREAPRPL